MKYLKEKLKKNTLPNFEELNRQELVDVITRTTLILQNFVYWEAIIFKKNETPDKIKELLLNDINEEISDLNNGAHTTLGEKFRTEIIEKTKTNISQELIIEIENMSNVIIEKLKNNSFIFGLSFLTTLENHNSMNYLEDISNKLGLNNIKYIEIHKEVDYGEGGHADNFLICLERYMKLNENEYNSGVEFAIRIINFRLGK